MGGGVNGKSGHMSVFTSFFEALNNAFEVHFFRALFYTISQTLIAYIETMQLILVIKWKYC